MSEDDDISRTKDLMVYTKAGIEEDLKIAKDQGALEITSEGSQTKSDESNKGYGEGYEDHFSRKHLQGINKNYYLTGNRRLGKSKPSQEYYGDTGHSINNVGGSINKNYSSTIKEQQAELSIRRLGVLLEHIGTEKKIFERDNPAIPSTLKENITDPTQSSKTLGYSHAQLLYKEET